METMSHKLKYQIINSNNYGSNESSFHQLFYFSGNLINYWKCVDLI